MLRRPETCSEAWAEYTSAEHEGLPVPIMTWTDGHQLRIVVDPNHGEVACRWAAAVSIGAYLLLHKHDAPLSGAPATFRDRWPAYFARHLLMPAWSVWRFVRSRAHMPDAALRRDLAEHYQVPEAPAVYALLDARAALEAESLLSALG